MSLTPEIIDSASLRPFNIPISDLQPLHPGKRLVVGVAIIARDFGLPPTNKLLILQRSDEEDSFPSMYELPGGGVEPEDQTILDTVVRETAEETGLAVRRISGVFDGFEYTTNSGDAIQFNFVVEVEGGIEALVRLNPAEHQAFAWIDGNQDLSAFKASGSMVKVISDALDICRIDF